MNKLATQTFTTIEPWKNWISKFQKKNWEKIEIVQSTKKISGEKQWKSM